jgi:hypothetical protein
LREASARSSEGRDAAVVVCVGRDGARGRGRDVEAFVRRVSLGRKTREGGDVGGGERGRAGGPRGAHRASRLRVARRGRERDERERHERYGLEEGAEEHVVVEGVGREVEGRAVPGGGARESAPRSRVAALDVEIDSDDAEEAASRGSSPSVDGSAEGNPRRHRPHTPGGLTRLARSRACVSTPPRGTNARGRV